VTEDRRGRTPSPDTGDESFIRHSGRGILLALYAALGSLKLYPVENATAQKALDELQGT